MATIKRFEDLKVWQEARALSQLVISLTNRDVFKHDFKLKYQIRDSAGSIMDNIAEGFERDGDKEFKQFCSIAKGSCGETRSQSYRCYDSGYISDAELNTLIQHCSAISEKLNRLMNYLKKSEYTGYKFKEPEIQYGNQAELRLNSEKINEITETEISDLRPETLDLGRQYFIKQQLETRDHKL